MILRMNWKEEESGETKDERGEVRVPHWVRKVPRTWNFQAAWPRLAPQVTVVELACPLLAVDQVCKRPEVGTAAHVNVFEELKIIAELRGHVT